MLESLANCLTDIQNWMSANFLKFNPDKTKFLVISSPQLKNKIHIQDLQVDDAIVQPSSDARNLGVSFDQFMTLEKHVSNTCQVSYMHIRRIAAIRRLLTTNAAEQLIHAFITTRLDFCNSLLAGPLKIHCVDYNQSKMPLQDYLQVQKCLVTSHPSYTIFTGFQLVSGFSTKSTS